MRKALLVNDNTPSHRTMRGTSRYLRHVVDGIVGAFGAGAVVFSTQKRDYGQATYVRAPGFRGVRRLGLHDAWASLLCAWYSPRVVLSTFFGKARAPAKSKEVFVVYDMTTELLTGEDQRVGYVARDIAEKKKCLERASALIAISANTARDVVRVYPHVDPSKIHVTPLGVDPFFFESDEAPALSERPYFVFVGYRSGPKNFANLLHAYGQSSLAAGVDLVVIAPQPFDEDERRLLREYDLESRVKLIARADEPTLRAAYRHALALIYPSTHEGFGLPILEAMASGTLVATSAASCMPEVGGDAAFYFDPYQPESIARTLRDINGLAAVERKARVDAGAAWAATFTWARCQRQTVDVIRGLIS